MDDDEDVLESYQMIPLDRGLVQNLSGTPCKACAAEGVFEFRRLTPDTEVLKCSNRKCRQPRRCVFRDNNGNYFTYSPCSSQDSITDGYQKVRLEGSVIEQATAEPMPCRACSNIGLDHTVQFQQIDPRIQILKCSNCPFPYRYICRDIHERTYFSFKSQLHDDKLRMPEYILMELFPARKTSRPEAQPPPEDSVEWFIDDSLLSGTLSEFETRATDDANFSSILEELFPESAKSPEPTNTAIASETPPTAQSNASTSTSTAQTLSKTFQFLANKKTTKARPNATKDKKSPLDITLALLNGGRTAPLHRMRIMSLRGLPKRRGRGLYKPAKSKKN